MGHQFAVSLDFNFNLKLKKGPYLNHLQLDTLKTKKIEQNFKRKLQFQLENGSYLKDPSGNIKFAILETFKIIFTRRNQN